MEREPIQIERFSNFSELNSSASYPALQSFLDNEADAHFFQSPEFLEFIGPVKGYKPQLWVAIAKDGRVVGSLLGVYQRDGSMLRSWLSRRLIVWGGPLGGQEAARVLIDALVKDARSKAIYVEFRNYFDTASIKGAFVQNGFVFEPHLNFLLELGQEEEALKRLSSTRRREIRSSLAAGAHHGEPVSEGELREFYDLLVGLYRDKVGKPLPHYDLFERFHTSPSGKVFVVRHEGKVIGGSAGPIYRGKVIYHWYVCGDNSIKGVHASVLATWAQIEYGVRNGYELFDFMGAGKPGQGYGVHAFKARFGGDEVAYGRYRRILEPGLYQVGSHGLKFYHRFTRKKGQEN